jgi:hypothetical protein
VLTPPTSEGTQARMVKVQFRCTEVERRNLRAVASLDGLGLEEWLWLTVERELERRRREGVGLLPASR